MWNSGGDQICGGGARLKTIQTKSRRSARRGPQPFAARSRVSFVQREPRGNANRRGLAVRFVDLNGAAAAPNAAARGLYCVSTNAMPIDVCIVEPQGHPAPGALELLLPPLGDFALRTTNSVPDRLDGIEVLILNRETAAAAWMEFSGFLSLLPFVRRLRSRSSPFSWLSA